MRFLHTSDLHLGIRVNDYPMIDEQKNILGQIIKIAVDEKVDGVLIAGDVYDKSVAPAEALGLLDDFLYELSDRDIPVFIISGNHDSAERLSHGRRSREKDNIFISGIYNGEVKPYVLSDRFGEVNIYLLPFIKPSTVSSVIAKLADNDSVPDGDEGDEKEKKTGSMSYNDALRWAVGKLNIDTSKRNIIVSHQYITNTDRAGSEEDYFSVGGVDNVDADVFGDFDYAALGHIHGTHDIGPEKRIRYSGTPLKYSFKEAKQEKTVTIVELCEKKGPGQKCGFVTRTVPLVPIHDMAEIRGSFEELTDESYYENAPERDMYLHIILAGGNDEPHAYTRLRDIYPRIMKLDRELPETASYDSSDVGSVNIEDKDPIDVVSEFYKLRNGTEMTDEQREFMLEIIEELRSGDK